MRLGILGIFARSRRASTMRRFRDAGWTVDNTRVGWASFMVRRDDVGLVAVCLFDRQLDTYLMFDLVQLGYDQHARVCVVTSELPSIEVAQSARDRTIILLEEREIGSLSDEFASLVEQRRVELAAAKVSKGAKLPPGPQSAARQLTVDERREGFIVATENVTCYLVERSPHLLILYFGDVSAANDKQEPPFAEAADWSVLGFNPSALNLFPDPDMQLCLSQVRPVLSNRFPNRVAIGSRQGGYGALRYSKLLKATITIALSPFATIDPTLTPDRRFVDFYKAAMHSGVTLSSDVVPPRSVLVYDPYQSDDAWHIRTIMDLTQAVELRLPFGGPNLDSLTANPDHMRGLIQNVVDGQFEKAQANLALLRFENERRAYLMGLYCSENRPTTGLKIFQAHATLDHYGDWMHVCYRLGQAGFSKTVMTWLSEATDRNQSDAEIQATAALVALKVPELELANMYIARAMSLSPRDEKYRFIAEQVTKARQAQL